MEKVSIKKIVIIIVAVFSLFSYLLWKNYDKKIEIYDDGYLALYDKGSNRRSVVLRHEGDIVLRNVMGFTTKSNHFYGWVNYPFQFFHYDFKSKNLYYFSDNKDFSNHLKKYNLQPTPMNKERTFWE